MPPHVIQSLVFAYKHCEIAGFANVTPMMLYANLGMNLWYGLVIAFMTRAMRSCVAARGDLRDASSLMLSFQTLGYDGRTHTQTRQVSIFRRRMGLYTKHILLKSHYFAPCRQYVYIYMYIYIYMYVLYMYIFNQIDCKLEAIHQGRFCMEFVMAASFCKGPAAPLGMMLAAWNAY